MAGNLQPLDEKFPIVTPDFRPTLYFIKWAQQRQIDIQAGITIEQLEEYLAAHQIQPGDGIEITPTGNLVDSPTITAKVQEILDQITDDHGSILFRGASAWEALPPGSAGEFLKTNGAGADPEWAAASGGSGGLTLISSQTVSGSSVASITFSTIPGTYKDLVLSLYGRGTTAAVAFNPRIRFNADTGANYDSDRVNRFGTAQVAAGTSAECGALPAATATAGVASTSEIIIPAYAATTFQKAGHFNGGVKVGTSAADLIAYYGAFWWRSTAAITQIDLICSAGNYDIGTVASLYGRG